MAERILILDDDGTRHAAFAARYSDAERVHVHSVAEALAALRDDGPRFDLATLDHDLGEWQIDCYGKREITGLEVAVAIARMDEERRPARVVVHSWNPPGALRMLDYLREAGVPCSYEPFAAESDAGRSCVEEMRELRGGNG